MNELSKKEDAQIEGTNSLQKEAASSQGVLQKKLENFLVLLYQKYLKGETTIEPQIQSAFLSLVQKNEDLAIKVRMMQLDYLKLENVSLEGKWNTAKEKLFPAIDFVEKPLDARREKIITNYKETIFKILKSSGEFSS